MMPSRQDRLCIAGIAVGELPARQDSILLKKLIAQSLVWQGLFHSKFAERHQRTDMNRWFWLFTVDRVSLKGCINFMLRVSMILRMILWQLIYKQIL